MTKVAFKLTEFLINFDSYHLMIADHCIKYMHAIRHLTIKFDISRDEELIIQIDFNSNSINQIDLNKQIFETSIDASFANEEERRSDESYTFKLFDDLIN
jgi:hypothetical protein